MNATTSRFESETADNEVFCSSAYLLHANVSARSHFRAFASFKVRWRIPQRRARVPPTVTTSIASGIFLTPQHRGTTERKRRCARPQELPTVANVSSASRLAEQPPRVRCRAFDALWRLVIRGSANLSKLTPAFLTTNDCLKHFLGRLLSGRCLNPWPNADFLTRFLLFRIIV